MKAFITSFFALLGAVSGINTIGESPEYICLPILGRPNNFGSIPAMTGVLPGTNGVVVQLQRHHIIPSSSLIRFANALLERSNDVNLRRLIDDHIRYLYQFYSNVGARNTFPNFRIRYDPNLSLTATEQELSAIIESAFVWMPGNIFYGPQSDLRADDPGSYFELESLHIIGRQHYQNLANLNNAMYDYVDDMNYRTTANFREIIRMMNELLQVTTPYAYVSAQWECVVVGGRNLYRINHYHHSHQRGKRSFKDLMKIHNFQNPTSNLDCIAIPRNDYIARKFVVSLF